MPHDIPTVDPLARLTAGGTWRLALQHSRDCHLLIWITRGQGTAILRGQRRGLGVHNALFVPAGTLFSVDPGPQGFGVVVTMPVEAQIPLPGAERHLRIRDVRIQGELTQLLEAMGREQAAQADFHGAAARAHATLIAIWLRRVLLAQPTEPQQRAEARLAATYSDLVARDYRSGRTMQAYAEMMGVTPTHLTRSIGNASGLTAAEMLAERVLHAARSQLADSDHPIGAIGAHLGFSSPAYFTRFIQNRTGKSPSQLRSDALALATA